MTVAELKAALDTVPDDAEVIHHGWDGWENQSYSRAYVRVDKTADGRPRVVIGQN